MSRRHFYRMFAIFAVLLLLAGANAQGFWRCADGDVCTTCAGEALPDDCAPKDADCAECCDYADASSHGSLAKGVESPVPACSIDCHLCCATAFYPIAAELSEEDEQPPPDRASPGFRAFAPTSAHGLRAPPVAV